MSQQDGAPIDRLICQHLQDLRRAGVTHLPLAVRQMPETEAAAAAIGHPAPQPPADDASSGRSQAPRRQTAVSSSLFSDIEPATSNKGPPDDMPHSPLSRSEREQRLQKLSECVAQCVRCEQLAATRTQTVFGVGNPEARVMFIGEAPGADEDRQGEPFVGRAGQLLNRIIAACRLKREDVYICNILKCRPPGNRNPAPEEARNCREYLEGQIRLVDPEYIICLGSIAAQNLLDTTASVGRLRGTFYTFGPAKVACTYHPSYLLRNPAAKKQVWEDMKFIFGDMGVTL